MGGDILLALLTIAGVTLAAIWFYGRLLRPLPNGGLWAVIPGRKDGDGLEQAVRAAGWLRSLGLADWDLVIVDVDLTPKGRELASHLADQWPEVALRPVSELPDLLERDSGT